MKLKMLHKILILVCFSFSIGKLSAQKTVGKASFYADKFDGRTTASGAVFRQNNLTAAHRTLPFGTKVRVTNLDNKKEVEVIINDRGPFVAGRIIDLSKRAAQKLDFIRKGTTNVEVEILGDFKVRETQKASNRKKEKPVNIANKTSYVNYYEVDTKSISPKGFGIQVASYKEVANLIKRCDDIKKKTNKNVLVQVVESNNQKVYRVIIGSFSTREKANTFNKKLKRKFTGSFVVAF